MSDPRTSRPSPHDARPRVAVVGAGVSGLGIAWRLAAAGCAVEVFEREAAGAGASWAAAGMLAARIEAEPGEEALLPLTLASQEMWPGFTRELETASGIEIGYRDDGTLWVALDHDDAGHLRFLHDYHRSQDLGTEWLSAREARRLEPHLHPGVRGAIWSPQDHQVDNRALAQALLVAARKAGAVVHEQAPVERILLSGSRATGVVVAGETRAADVVVLAAGAWSAEIAGLPAEAVPPVRPLKGQMLAVRQDPAAPILTRVLWTPEIYCVPRRDGRLLVGATVEEKGWDSDLTAGGLLHLLREAWEVLPGIDELPMLETWVGFRPTSRDDAPIYGPTAVDGLVLATGHHRNGILLAPITADAIAGYILDGVLPEAARPFTLARFGAGTRIEEAVA